MKINFVFPFPRALALLSILVSATFVAVSARADVVFAWNEAMLQLPSLIREPLAPHVEARAFAMAHQAMAEAIASVPAQASAAALLDAQRSAIVCAAHDVLVSLLPAGARQLDALAARHLGGISDPVAKTQGSSTGVAAAVRILMARENDGWVEIALSNPPSGPRPDASEGAAGALARGEQLPPSPWLKARPFGLKNVQQFRVAEFQTLNHDGKVEVDAALQHSKLFDTVDREAAFAAAERCWSQRSLATWNRIARQMSVGRANDLARQARLLAALNVALADATLATMHCRHTVGTWRITTTDTWESINGTAPRSTDVMVRVDGYENVLARKEMRRVLIPPTPNYPSLAATLAGAAQASLAEYFTTDQMSFALPIVGSTNGDAEVHPPRTFTRISAAARECAFLSTLDGRHSREACVSGYSLGASVGSYATKRALAGRR